MGCVASTPLKQPTQPEYGGPLISPVPSPIVSSCMSGLRSGDSDTSSVGGAAGEPAPDEEDAGHNRQRMDDRPELPRRNRAQRRRNEDEADMVWGQSRETSMVVEASVPLGRVAAWIVSLPLPPPALAKVPEPEIYSDGEREVLEWVQADRPYAFGGGGGEEGTQYVSALLLDSPRHAERSAAQAQQRKRRGVFC